MRRRSLSKFNPDSKSNPNAHRLIVFFLTAALSLVLGRAAAQEKIAIARALEPGTYSVSQEFFFSLIVSVGQTNQTAQEKARFLWTMRVEKPADGEGRDIHLSLNRAIFQAQNKKRLARPLTFDSEYASLASPVLRKFYDRLLQADIGVRLDGALNAVESSGLETLLANLTETAGDDSDATILLSVLKNIFDPSSLTEMFSQMFYLLPPGEVQLGDRWTNETPISLPVVGKTPVRWETELTRIDDYASVRRATLLGKSQIQFDAATNVEMTLDAIYDLQTGLNLELISRAVVTKTEPITVAGEDHQAKTVGMVRSIQKITPRQ